MNLATKMVFMYAPFNSSNCQTNLNKTPIKHVKAEAMKQTTHKTTNNPKISPIRIYLQFLRIHVIDSVEQIKSIYTLINF